MAMASYLYYHSCPGLPGCSPKRLCLNIFKQDIATRLRMPGFQYRLSPAGELNELLVRVEMSKDPILFSREVPRRGSK